VAEEEGAAFFPASWPGLHAAIAMKKRDRAADGRPARDAGAQHASASRTRALHAPAPGPGARRSSAAQETVKQVLHRGIVTGTIPGGTRLVQSRIAAELGVGTRPVRDALRELAAEGFVRLDDRGSAVVHELSRTELEDIYEIRKMLEPVATARAAKYASRASLLKAVGLMEAMESETDGAQWADYNCRFHSVIEEAGNSPILVSMLKNLRELSALYVTHSILSEPDRVRCGNAEHNEILQAIITRDPEAAADAMLRHLDGTIRTLLNVHRIGSPRQTVHGIGGGGRRQ
jgi:DNA-binding GntR family transcriptional regulator